MSLVSVRGVHKAFGDHVVLRSIDLEVAAGSVTVLIGPSGSGKTTLLRCLNGLDRPQEGVVTVNDVTLDFAKRPSGAEVAALRAQSGMVFQAHHLFPHRTALENITEGPIHVQREPAAEARARGMALLAQVGLTAKADAYPHELSGGQQQRVGIARALALRPKLILFDEPTSALDPETVGDVLVVMRDLAKQGWTMVVVTHEIRFAEQVADHVAFLDGGVIVEDGPPSQVLGHPVEPRTRQFLRRVLDPLSADLDGSDDA
ncbi:amino acid ABC transporter ATP-binding protein [Propionicicella superfundia]|uniref:amino acid ABC transporter ATP-binding protein n=1 Tax=Propionicicella superfundia TaxID=348582 RepID=UPI000415C654|nr:amino acid ABC transporter ATP-binding protein [Propionicicella superfundia]